MMASKSQSHLMNLIIQQSADHEVTDIELFKQGYMNAKTDVARALMKAYIYRNLHNYPELLRLDSWLEHYNSSQTKYLFLTISPDPGRYNVSVKYETKGFFKWAINSLPRMSFVDDYILVLERGSKNGNPHIHMLFTRKHRKCPANIVSNLYAGYCGNLSDDPEHMLNITEYEEDDVDLGYILCARKRLDNIWRQEDGYKPYYASPYFTKVAQAYLSDPIITFTDEDGHIL